MKKNNTETWAPIQEQRSDIVSNPTMKNNNIETPSRRHRMLVGISIISLAILLLLGSLAGLFIIEMQPTTVQTSPITQSSPVPTDQRTASQAIAQQYMMALLKQQYSTMWSLLHPNVQAIWPNETTFAHFWQVRFQNYTLQNFVLGQPQGFSQWVNPETMVVYKQVIKLPISLQLQPNSTLQPQSALPPEDLHPSQVFQNLPFIIQQSDSQNKQWRILNGGPADLEAPILPPLHPANKTVQVPILMYHHITDVPTTNLLDLSLTVTTAHFIQQLNYLKAHGYHTITFNQMFAALYYGGPLPAHPIILTFDDGYQDAYQYALPILQAHGFSGMFYIVTGFVGAKSYITWPEIRSMLAAGMQIGSHTIHHVNIGSTLMYSPQQAQHELQASQSLLQQNLGILIQQFCYPSGEPFRHGSLALQQRIVILLAADGYVGATTDPGQTGTNQNSQSPFDLLRLRIDGRESFQGFIASLPS